MADEFAKGLGILTAGGLGWMVLAGWYNTPSFEGAQLFGKTMENLGAYGGIAVMLRDVMLWFAITGAIVFWVVIPAMRELRAAWADRS
ncbi:MAG: hypothetical protein ABEJ70_05160 [Halobacteriaceae archaeon]